MRLDAQLLSLTCESGPKFGKHAAWIMPAAWAGVTLVAYFTPMSTLLGELAAFSFGLWESYRLQAMNTARADAGSGSQSPA